MTGESGVVITTWGHIKASQLSRILITNANLVHVQVSIEISIPGKVFMVLIDLLVPLSIHC